MTLKKLKKISRIGFDLKGKNMILNSIIKICFGLIFLSSCSNNVNKEYKGKHYLKDYLKNDLQWNDIAFIYEGRFKKNSVEKLLNSKKEIASFKTTKIYGYELFLGCSDCFRYYKLLQVINHNDNTIVDLNFENEIFAKNSDFSLQDVESFLNYLFASTGSKSDVFFEKVNKIFIDFMNWEIKKNSLIENKVVYQSNYGNVFTVEVQKNNVKFSLNSKGSLW